MTNINPYDKYTEDFLEKVLTAMTNIFTAMPKQIFKAIVPTVSMVSGVS